MIGVFILGKIKEQVLECVRKFIGFLIVGNGQMKWQIVGVSIV